MFQQNIFNHPISPTTCRNLLTFNINHANPTLGFQLMTKNEGEMLRFFYRKPRPKAKAPWKGNRTENAVERKPKALWYFVKLKGNKAWIGEVNVVDWLETEQATEERRVKISVGPQSCPSESEPCAFHGNGQMPANVVTVW